MKFFRSILCGAGFLIFLFASLTASAQKLFDSWVSYGIDKQPRAIQSADMDADGDLDLIIGHSQGRAGRATVIMLENDGVGNFSLRYTLYPGPLSGPVVSVNVFDLDLDGDLDILTTHPLTHKADLFRNRGPGLGFELPIECRTGRQPLSVTAGRLDNDIFPEVVTANFSSGTLSIYKNRGAALFPAESTKVVSFGPRSVVLLDYDNDGDNDIAVSVTVIRQQTGPPDGFNGFVLFENQGNGAFDDSARVFYKIANPSGSNPLLFDDLNPHQLIAADFDNM